MDAGAADAADGAASHQRGGRRRRRDDKGSMSLEIVLVMPVLTLLALFVLWAGRGGRAGLIADLAAEEAATAAALACERHDDPNHPDQPCEEFVADVLSARPGLDYLCINGARPNGREEGLVAHRLIRFDRTADPKPQAGGAVLFGVQFLCETDGAVAPLRGLLPTVTFHGQAVEVAIVQAAPGAGILDAEADEGSPLRFVVSLDAPAVAEVMLSYTVAAADAALTAAGDDCEASPKPDYEEPQSLTVTFAEGDTEAAIEVVTCDDVIDETDEMIIVTLGDPPGPDPENPDSPPLIAIDDREAVGIIKDNDDPP